MFEFLQTRDKSCEEHYGSGPNTLGTLSLSTVLRYPFCTWLLLWSLFGWSRLYRLAHKTLQNDTVSVRLLHHQLYLNNVKYATRNPHLTVLFSRQYPYIVEFLLLIAAIKYFLVLATFFFSDNRNHFGPRDEIKRKVSEAFQCAAFVWGLPAIKE